VSSAATGSFDELAESYDRYRIGYADDLYDALGECGVHEGARVLDVACGTGIVTDALARRGCTLTAIDISEPMLERARRRVPRATFVIGRAENLPFLDDSFDAATSAQAFHWMDHRRALDELARVVRPGGIVAIWWKGLMRGDATGHIRKETARELGLVAPPDLLGTDFVEFEASQLVEQRLRVIPWIVHMRVGDYLGYERTRARARDAYGSSLEPYFARLAQRLGPPDGELSLSYLHLLYLGRVPAL
jgi:ubiquinone/menaquinone biosynthesis C-methylase UbiE